MSDKKEEEILDDEGKEELTDKILEKEKKLDYQSSMFSKIENEVKECLKNQKTDDALRDITIGALYLGSSDIHYDSYENEVTLRFRIDGVLVDIFTLNHLEYKYILERLKYASHLKLNISNVPQD
jgi:type II secretory ATPase GspE/PulE/Tfp pilus assembly ATPase PilB-like protein